MGDAQVPCLGIYSPARKRPKSKPSGRISNYFKAQKKPETHWQNFKAFAPKRFRRLGKSRASVALAVAGALGLPWFGLPVHHKFKTLIVQNENGRYRLKQEFSELDCAALDEFVKVCPRLLSASPLNDRISPPR